MKIWFKHEFGFVNIDDENVYLTNTGNWSEIKSMKEKDKKVSSDNRGRKNKMLFFLYLSIGCFALIFFANLISGNNNIFGIFGLPVAGYFLYQYLSPEMGPRFIIPKSKIINIEAEETAATIYFRDKNNSDDLVKLNRLDNHALGHILNLTKK